MKAAWSRRVADVLGTPVHDDYGRARVDVEPTAWVEALRTARDGLGCTFFDWLTAVDELDDGYRLVCHLALPPDAGPPDAGPPMRELIVRTLLPRDEPVVSSAVEVFGGASWHEREVTEMFGVRFTAGDHARLLLPPGFEGHPLRKDFVLAARVVAPWPGAKQPGESDRSLADRSLAEQAPTKRPGRRRSRPPGVPDPDEWGPR